MEEGDMSNDEIIEKILNVASLRTFMIPDAAMPSNFPEHIETYELPHIIINGEWFWGKTENTHSEVVLGTSLRPKGSFCYTNIGEIFCSYIEHLSSALMMSKKRYKQHAWFFKDNFRLVWNSSQDTSTEAIKKAIENCSKFKIALLDSEDMWNIHPIDLPMYYSEDKSFELKTVRDDYPIFFRHPDYIQGLLKTYLDFFNARPADNSSGIIKFEGPKVSSFYLTRSDGGYYNADGVEKNTIRKYKRLKVFVDQM